MTLDADLQDDPSEIPNLLARLDEGCDVVSGWKRKRRDPLSKTSSGSQATGLRPSLSAPATVIGQPEDGLQPRESIPSVLPYETPEPIGDRRIHDYQPTEAERAAEETARQRALLSRGGGS